MIMEGEKSKDIQSKGLRTRRVDGVSSIRVQRQKKTDVPAWTPSGREREQILACSAFCSIQALSGLDVAHPHCGVQSALFSLLIQMLISSPNTLIDTLRIRFNQMSGHPVAQSCWYIKWTITGSSALLNRGLRVAIPSVCHTRYGWGPAENRA